MNYKEIMGKAIRVLWQTNIKELPKNANLFVKNIDTSVTSRQFEQFFSKYGGIFSTQLKKDEKNFENLGYGYV